ncbi:MAG: exodeoxyribonuclease III [Bacteroidetes bacterium]|nr:exodeoxyribonuclease III [Bacteroidota bacterium]MCH8523215.1 exodeoxyribonuclease III [Balneolales bacterium]
MLKIASYNVNGIRAAHRKGLTEWINRTKPDVICFQELKADESQVPEQLKALNYHQFYHPAEKKGYSGVAIFTNIAPDEVEIGMGVDWVDAEGRVIRARIKGIDVFSVYAPSGTTGDARQALKMAFLDAFTPFIRRYNTGDNPVVFCGDFNIAHTEIDIHNPIANKKTSGFLPEERAWVTSILNDEGLRDVFREHHPAVGDLYSWWTYRAGAKGNNKGWRIDYHFANKLLADKRIDAVIERELDLSDHAPVTVTYDF